MKNLILIFFLAILSGCGGSGPAATSSADKNIFSSWAQDSSTFVLNMTGGTFGTFSFTYLLTGNAICDCTLTIGGTQASGNAVMSGCAYRGGTGGGSDPGCAALDASYTYTNGAGVLKVCNGGSCNTYH